MKNHTQILVVGAGPAGSTAAALLAKEGLEVTILEKDFFPRYHIGESLIVSVQETLDLLEVKQKVKDHGFLVKSGAIMNWGQEKWTFDWSKLPGRNKSSFQVKREEFDTLLLNHAKDLGAQVTEGVTINSIGFEGDRPVSANWTRKFPENKPPAEGEATSGVMTFDYLIDCSGRTGIMATKYLKSRVWNNAFKNIAAWSYWTNVQHHGTQLENPILVNSIPEGWIWVIPLHDGTTSIGCVIRHDYFTAKREEGMSKEEIYLETLKKSEPVAGYITGANMIAEIKSEGDYSYHSNVVCGPRYFMCGDSACFLDPLLSTGCHLAMYSATLAAASLLSILRNEVTEEEARHFYTKAYLQHFVRWVIVVASFSNIRAGKESYFWQAQSLITEDIKQAQGNEDIRMCFTKMVSGMEDIKEVQDIDLLDEFSGKLKKKLYDPSNQATIPALVHSLIDENQKAISSHENGHPYMTGVHENGNGHENGKPSTKAAPAFTHGMEETCQFMDTTVDNIEMVTVPRLGLRKTVKSG